MDEATRLCASLTTVVADRIGEALTDHLTRFREDLELDENEPPIREDELDDIRDLLVEARGTTRMMTVCMNEAHGEFRRNGKQAWKNALRLVQEAISVFDRSASSQTQNDADHSVPIRSLVIRVDLLIQFLEDFSHYADDAGNELRSTESELFLTELSELRPRATRRYDSQHSHFVVNYQQIAEAMTTRKHPMTKEQVRQAFRSSPAAPRLLPGWERGQSHWFPFPQVCDWALADYGVKLDLPEGARPLPNGGAEDEGEGEQGEGDQ